MIIQLPPKPSELSGYRTGATYDGAPEIEKFATVAHAGDDEEDDNNDA